MTEKVSDNLPPNVPSEPIYTLPRKCILRGKNNFQRIFREGIQFHSKTIDLKFLVFPEIKEGCKVGFVAGKRLGNAVKRNHIKRLIREAYRLNQYILTDFCKEQNFGLHCVLIAKDTNTDFNTVENDCINLLKRVRKHIQNTL